MFSSKHSAALSGRVSSGVRKALRFGKSPKFRGFTLVELIVVITILAILATIGFLALSGYTSDANRSAVLSNLRTVEKGITVTASVTGKFPAPSNSHPVTYSGGVVWNQGTAGKSVMAAIGMGEPPKDPQGKAEFDYSVTANGMEYQVASAYFGPTASVFVPVAEAALVAPTAVVSGNYNGLFAPVSTGGVNYLVAAPTIIFADLSYAEMTNAPSGGMPYLVDGQTGTPASWSGKVEGLVQTGVVFGGTAYVSGVLYASGGQAFPTDSDAISQLAQSVTDAYSGTVVATATKISAFLASATNLAATSVVAAGENALGRLLAPATAAVDVPVEYTDATSCENGGGTWNSGTSTCVFCPSGFVKVPNSASMSIGGTSAPNGWCVAKWEMSYVSNTAGQSGCWGGEPYGSCGTARGSAPVTSQANAAPVNYVNQSAAETLCATQLKDGSGNALSGGHLPSVALWKKIADDAASQGVNWSGNAPGSGNMSRGCSNSNCNGGNLAVTKADAADGSATAANPAAGNFYDKRVWKLSNGAVVHDLSGNAWEWFYDRHANANCGSYSQFTAGAYSYGGTSLEPSDATWDSAKGVGKICSTSAAINTVQDYGAIYGGDWAATADAGVFTTLWAQYNASTTLPHNVSFRCVVPMQ